MVLRERNDQGRSEKREEALLDLALVLFPTFYFSAAVVAAHTTLHASRIHQDESAADSHPPATSPPALVEMSLEYIVTLSHSRRRGQADGRTSEMQSTPQSCLTHKVRPGRAGPRWAGGTAGRRVIHRPTWVRGSSAHAEVLCRCFHSAEKVTCSFANCSASRWKWRL